MSTNGDGVNSMSYQVVSGFNETRQGHISEVGIEDRLDKRQKYQNRNIKTESMYTLVYHTLETQTEESE